MGLIPWEAGSAFQRVHAGMLLGGPKPSGLTGDRWRALDWLQMLLYVAMVLYHWGYLTPSPAPC